MNKEDFKKRYEKITLDLQAIFLALKDRRTPLLARVLAYVTLAYFLSPIDLIPDFIPILGYLDDVIILPLLISLTLKLIPRDLFLECRDRASDLWKDGKPKKWYYALPIILIYIIIIYFLARLILRLIGK